MQNSQPHTLSFKEFKLDLTRGRLLRKEEEIKLRPKSFETLKHLVENNGRLISKNELIAALWPDTSVTDDSLVQCLIEVRRALGDEGTQILKTVPRRGYIFDVEVQRNGTVQIPGDIERQGGISEKETPGLDLPRDRAKWVRSQTLIVATTLVFATSFSLVGSGEFELAETFGPCRSIDPGSSGCAQGV